MSPITHPENIGCQIFTRDATTERIWQTSTRCAKGDVKTAPVTLTVGSGRTPTFSIRGTHAFGILGFEHQSVNWGAVALVVLTITFAVVAIFMLRPTR